VNTPVHHGTNTCSRTGSADISVTMGPEMRASTGKDLCPFSKMSWSVGEICSDTAVAVARLASVALTSITADSTGRFVLIIPLISSTVRSRPDRSLSVVAKCFAPMIDSRLRIRVSLSFGLLPDITSTLRVT
jgi:hypothetical protein